MTRMKNDDRISLRLPEDDKRQLLRLADRMDCTLSEVVLMAIRAYIHDKRSTHE